jgi:MinD superfamily P-loop ATPase
MLSGKGGTGKTSLTAAFADLFIRELPKTRLVIVDADVDAANLHLVLSSTIVSQEPFLGGSLAVIDETRCSRCGTCQEVCRFEAVLKEEELFEINPLACEGCAACLYQCPEDAITLQEQLAGEWYRSNCPYGVFFHAHLHPAKENTGKLVALIKQKAKDEYQRGGYQLMLVDGPPGIGCPVISSITGADAALIVTEPSLAGIHDLKRILATTAHFGIQAYVCINKGDIFPEACLQIRQHCADHKVPVVGEIPYDLEVHQAMIQGKPITKAAPNSSAAQAIFKIWDHLFLQAAELSSKPALDGGKSIS